jgi:hypothetical protein
VCPDELREGYRIGDFALVAVNPTPGSTYYCKASPHPDPSVILDSIGIGALLGRNPSQPTDKVGCGFAVVGVRENGEVHQPLALLAGT